MAPERPITASPRPLRFVTLLASALFVAGLAMPGPAHALKVATWNLLGYDDGATPSVITPRQPAFRTVMAAMDPDVIIVQELITAGAADSFMNVLNVAEPGQWMRGIWINSTPSAQSVIYWKPAKVNVTTQIALNEGGPRDVLLSIVKPIGYLTNPGWFRLYSIHLKAGNTSADSMTRHTECSNLRTAVNNLVSQGPNFMVGGDTNFYSAFEPGYLALTQSLGGTNGNNGRCLDPLGAQMANHVWNSDPAFASYDTQSPCLGCPSVPGLSFSGGGMDDRFDMLLSSYSLADGQGVDRVDYYAFGQDGQHFNGDINSPPTNGAVGQVVADALWGASDHLPVVTVLQLASRVVAPAALSFGSAIVGGVAQQTLNVSDGGTPPVDVLDYSFSGVPAGFTAPAGSFTVANGSIHPHTLGMDTSTPGLRAGTLTMTTDDPDSTSKPVQLSGTVLDHAQPSLDSQAVTTALTIDWGTRPGRTFGDTTVAIYNHGYGPLRARLSVTGATITGSSRFHLVGASFPALIAGDGDPYTIHFDVSGASTDTLYQATLTFDTADEALPGATSLAPLVVTLSAHPSDVTGVGDAPVGALAFLAPRPNPASSGCTIGFDLPRPATAELAIFDLSGRRIATLASGAQDAGRHRMRWDAMDTNGSPVRAGVYLARFHTSGLDRTARIVVLR